jgi:hypothetical protein
MNEKQFMVLFMFVCLALFSLEVDNPHNESNCLATVGGTMVPLFERTVAKQLSWTTLASLHR